MTEPQPTQREAEEPAKEEIVTPSQADFLFAFLKENEAFCPLCQYNLRGLTVARCPECGREIRLAVGIDEPYLIPWILTTIFVAMAASVGVFFILACIIAGPPTVGAVGARELPIFLGICYGVMAIPLTAVLIALRRRFWKLGRETQQALAAGALAVNVLLVLWCFTLIR